MLNEKWVDAEFYDCEVKTTNDNKVEFRHIKFSEYGNAYEEIARKALSLVQGESFFLKVRKGEAAEYFHVKASCILDGSFKIDGVATGARFWSNYADDDLADFRDSVEGAFNIEPLNNRIIILRYEEKNVSNTVYNEIDPCSGEISHDEFERRENEGSGYRTEYRRVIDYLGDVVKEDDRTVITYKDGSITVLSDFAVTPKHMEVAKIEKIDEKAYESGDSFLEVVSFLEKKYGPEWADILKGTK